VDGSAGADKGAAIGLEIVMLVFHWRHLNEQKRQTTSGWSARSFDPDNLNPLRQQGKGLPDDGKLQHPNLYQVRRAKMDNAGRMVAKGRGEGNEDGQAKACNREAVCNFTTQAPQAIRGRIFYKEKLFNKSEADPNGCTCEN